MIEFRSKEERRCELRKQGKKFGIFGVLGRLSRKRVLKKLTTRFSAESARNCFYKLFTILTIALLMSSVLKLTNKPNLRPVSLRYVRSCL